MSSDNPSIAELHDNSEYQIIEACPHAEIFTVVRKYLFKPSLLMLIYLFANLWAVLLIFRFCLNGEEFWWDKLSYIGLGFFCGFFLLLPIHEYVHLIAYKFFRVSNVQVKYQLNNLSAFCVADKFVIDGKRFVLVALAPFIIINISIVLLICFSPSTIGIYLSGVLLLHIGACSGDIGLSNLVWLNRDEKI